MSRPCPFCGAGARKRFRTRDFNRKTTYDTFDYYRCGECGLTFLFPIPPEIGRYYPESYYDLPASLEELSRRARAESYKLDIVRRFAPPGRLLEVGPAYGCFALLAKEAGFTVDAIEMDARCRRYLEEVVGIDALPGGDLAGTLESCPPYGTIALWHVIEHIPDPWDVLRMLAGKLLPGGILVLASPNPDALQFRLLSRRWAHVDAPRHVALLPASLLETVLRPLGMEPVLFTTTDPGSLGWDTFGWQVSLSNFSDRAAVKRWLSIGGFVAARVTAVVERRRNRGSAYTIVFRKKIP